MKTIFNSYLILYSIIQIILVIYSRNDATIKILIQASPSAGVHSISWDGTDFQDKIVPAGIISCPLQDVGTTQ